MKNYTLIAFFTLTLFSCHICRSQNVTSTIQDFEFHNGKDGIFLEFPNGNQYLVLNKESILNIKLENIDPKSLTVSGRGIKYAPMKKNDTNLVALKVIAIQEYVNENLLQIIISYIKDNDIISHKFLIPVRN